MRCIVAAGWLLLTSAAHAQELQSGAWTMDVYRPDAPLDLVLLEVVDDVGSYAALDQEGGTILVNFRLQEGDIWFVHAGFNESCRLMQQAEGVWHGTCPPDQESEFDEGLTITLHAPRADEPSGDSNSDDPNNDSQPRDDGSSVDSEEKPNVDTDDGES